MKPARSMSTLANPSEAPSLETPVHLPRTVSGFVVRPQPAMKKPLSSNSGSDTTDPALDDDTAVMKLSPAFLEAVRAIAPKRRHSKLPYVFVLALLTVAAVLGRDRPTREFLMQRWHQYRGTAPAVTMSASATASPTAPSAAISAVASPAVERPQNAPAAPSVESVTPPLPAKDRRVGPHKVASPSRR
jgi:hypothetical protein